MYRRLRRRLAPPAATGSAPQNSRTSSESEGGTDDDSPPAALTVTVDAAPPELSGLRSTVADFCRRHGAGDDVIDDVQLVVSELATNVLRHTVEADVTTTIRVDPIDEQTASPGPAARRWALAMSGARDIPGIENLETPSVDQETGRGLLIVSAIVDSFEIDADGDTVRCTLVG